jgi:hypothetical protein
MRRTFLLCHPRRLTRRRKLHRLLREYVEAFGEFASLNVIGPLGGTSMLFTNLLIQLLQMNRWQTFSLRLLPQTLNLFTTHMTLLKPCLTFR